MAKSVNKVILIGSVGKDPEVKTTQGGSNIAKFSLATNDRTKVNGEWQDKTEWHNLVAFGKTAEVIGEYVKKGNRLYIEGKLSTSSWEDKDSGTTKYRTEIIIDDLVLLSGKPEGATSSQGNSSSNGRSSSAPSGNRNQTNGRGNTAGNARQQAAPQTAAAVDDDDEDIPF